jgi:hypothetical protein
MKKIPMTMSSTTQRGTRKRLRHIFLAVVVEGIVIVAVCFDSDVGVDRSGCCCSGEVEGRYVGVFDKVDAVVWMDLRCSRHVERQR